MDYVEDDLHDSLIAAHHGLEFGRLNDALKACGIADAKLRRKICTTYFFDSAQSLDGGWFADSGGRYQPGLHFAEVNEADQLTGKVVMPDPDAGTMLHEYTHGTAIWLFDDRKEDVSSIDVGKVSGRA